MTDAGPVSEAIRYVLNQGLLGVFALAEAYVIVKLYKAKEDQAESHRKEIAQHNERYAVKAEKYGDKNGDLAEGVMRFVREASARKARPRDDEEARG